MRAIACDGIFNLRDYGGYAVLGGGRLRRGRLFRSAQHRDATVDDLGRVEAINLTTIVDLRGGSERAAAPCPRPRSFSAEVISTDEETVDPARIAADRSRGARGVETSAEATEAIRTAYRNLPFRPILARLYRRYFEMLANSEGPSLIHCMAGKDRTGIGVALLHHVVGVHQDDMMEDYLLTNSAPGRDAWVKRVSAQPDGPYSSWSDEAVQVLLSVNPVFLHSAFDEMRERHGSVDNYMEQALSVDATRRDAIREKLIV